jgi:Gram-negative porin
VVLIPLNEQNKAGKPMKQVLFLTPLAVLVSALPSLALDFGDGFSATGEFELEYAHVGSGETLGYGSADIAYQQPAGGFGGFVGFDAVSLGGDTEIAPYGAVSYSGEFGKIQLGVPRAALDDYIDTPSLGGLRFFDLQSAGLTHSVLTTAYLVGDTDTPLGIRYDGAFGDTRIGTSVHRVEGATIVDVAVQYQLGTTQLRGGLENVRQGGASDTSLHIGAESDFGQVKAGVLLSNINTVGNGRAAQLYAIYTPMEQLNVTGTLLSINSGGDTNTLYGVAADYTFGQGTYVEAGIADGSDTSGLYNLSLGLKF